MMYFDFIFNSLRVGLVFLLLTAHRFRNFCGLTRFFICVTSMLLIVVLGISSTFSNIDRTACEVLALCFFISIAIPLSFFGTAKLIKNRYRPAVFVLLLALFLFVLCITFMIGYVVTGVIYSNVMPPIVPTLLQILMIGSVLSLVIYLINLPFLIVGFVVPFYRKRICDFLRLQTNIEVENSLGLSA